MPELDLAFFLHADPQLHADGRSFYAYRRNREREELGLGSTIAVFATKPTSEHARSNALKFLKKFSEAINRLGTAQVIR